MASSSNEGQRGLHPALSPRQAFALLEEAGSVRNLMRDSIQTIREMNYVHLAGDSVFTLGSIGVEKAMKLMLGCAEVADTGAWPSKETLKGWGHDIEGLNALTMQSIKQRISQSSVPGYAACLQGRMKESELLPLIFATFARYGKSGRFHHLDILATDEPGTHDQPSEYWGLVERQVQVSRSDFHDIPYGDNAALDNYGKALRNVIADELDAWWFCLHRIGVQGCFGNLGKKVGWEIWEVDRPEPKSVKV